MVKENIKKSIKRKITRKNTNNELTKKKKKYDSLSVNEFLENEIDSDHSNASENSNKSNDNSDHNFDEDYTSRDSNTDENVELDFGEDPEDTNSEEEDINFDEFDSHKESLAKLKEIDPEFYKFLEENDKKLLNFDASESEEDDDEKDNDEDTLHKPTGDLEVASDESDFELDDENTPIKGGVITLKLLKQWQNDIQTDKSSKTIKCLTKAFNAALMRVSGDDEVNVGEYKVDGSSIFNGVIQVCVLELGTAFQKFLKLKPGSKQPACKCKRFVKIKTAAGGYLSDLLKLLGGVTSANIQRVLLKHLHGLTWLLIPFSKICKKALKKLIHLWSSAEEEIRVLAFLCILRLVTQQQTSLLEPTLRSMYMSFVRNCKFISLNTLAEVNFMRRSLTEMFLLDTAVSYGLVFLYIRQLAIHLRTAVTLRNTQNICNWQYVNCLRLWSHLLGLAHRDVHLQPLLYPLVQIVLGTLHLMQSFHYFPLRFNLIQLLIEVSREADMFIPLLPFLSEVLTSFDFNKKHKKVTMKPMQFACILRVSKSQMAENGFKDASMNAIYALLLEYLSDISHTISFPDTALMCTLQMKQFLKKCNVANYCRKIRQLVDKLMQNCNCIEQERCKISFGLADSKQIEALESNIKNKGTPLKIFYESWRKVHEQQKRKQFTENDAIADYALPHLKKIPKKSIKKTDGPVELFPSDSEEEEKSEKLAPIEEPKKVHKKKKKKHSIAIKHKADNDMDHMNHIQDIVEDTKSTDW